MTGPMQVDPARLREAARFVTEKAQVMRDGLKVPDDTIGKRLLAEGWEGKAATGYDGSWSEWHHGADTIIAALEESATKLTEAANAYET